MQQAVARKYREADDPGTVFEEDMLYEAVVEELNGQGVDQDIVQEQIRRLRGVRAEIGREGDVVESPTEVFREDDDCSAVPIGRAACDTEDDLVDACGGAAGESPDSPFDNVIAEVGIPPGSGEGMEASLGMYVVSLRAKGQYRCLHRVGACHLRPGVDYRRYRTLGVELPKAKDYDGDCKRCFTKGGLDPQEQGSSSTSGSSSGEE